MELETVTSCPGCGTTVTKPWVAAEDRQYGVPTDGMQFARCSRCGIVFLMRRPVESQVGVLYIEGYEPYAGSATDHPAELCDDPPSRMPTVGKARWLELVRPVYRPVPAGGRLLDFGCGSPRFLSAARELGWTALGADFADGVVARVRAAGIPAFRVDELPDAVDAGSIHRIRMNHVLEHLYDPRDTLRRLRSLLAPGGLLHIAVPNPGSLTARVTRRYWSSLDPRHVVLFPPRPLEAIVRATGYEVVGLAHQPSARDVRRSVGFVLDAARTPIRVRTALTRRRAELAYAVVAAAAGALGGGDRLHLVARA